MNEIIPPATTFMDTEITILRVVVDQREKDMYYTVLLTYGIYKKL